MNAQTRHEPADGFTACPYCASLRDDAHPPACYPWRGPDLVCCLSSCLTRACKSSPLAKAGSLQGVFFLPFLADDRQFVWWPAGMRFTHGQQIALWCVWAALDDEHRHIFTVYRCIQKSDYLQGHVAHHMCFPKWYGQVRRVHLNGKSSRLTQPVTVTGPKHIGAITTRLSQRLLLPDLPGGWIILARDKRFSTACVTA